MPEGRRRMLSGGAGGVTGVTGVTGVVGTTAVTGASGVGLVVVGCVDVRDVVVGLREFVVKPVVLLSRSVEVEGVLLRQSETKLVELL